MTWRARSARFALPAVATLLMVLATLSNEASASTYHVYSCRIPYGPHAGEPAPVQVASGGGEEAGRWSANTTGSGLYGERCSTGGDIEAALQAGVSHSESDQATWAFDAPAGETITGATIWRASDADGGTGYVSWLATHADPSASQAVTSTNTFDGCAYTWGCPHPQGIGDRGVPLSVANQVDIPAEHLPSERLYFNASCERGACASSSGDEQGYAVVVYVYATDIALEEQGSPVVSDVSGELASAAQVSGDASLYFDASDAGSGVYRGIVSVDGKVLESPVIGQGELCHEAPVPAEYEPAFLSAQPCAASVSGHLSLHTEQLSNGPHKLLVQITNAAGDATTAIERTIDVANGAVGATGSESAGTLTQALSSSLQSGIAGANGAMNGAPNGEPASGHATLTADWVSGANARVSAHGLQLTGGFAMPETISGILVGPGGQPIADATIAVSAKQSYGGARTLMLPSARSGANGRFVVRLRRTSPSERLTLTYSPTLGGEPVASQSLTLLVKADVSLSVRPGTVSAGQTIRLQGRVLGGPIPSGGKQVVLEARSGSSPWLQFLVLRSGADGRFKGSHRFRLQGPVRYWFRAVCPQEADFPYAAGASAGVSVWER